MRVSGGDLCEAEAPTEPTGETKRTALAAAELQLNENKRANSVEICKLFGFPHTIIDGGASEDDNKKFTAAVVALLNQIETALDAGLLLEKEKEQGYYWAFDVKELTRGSLLERFQAYHIACADNILQIDEIRKEEDYEPTGFNYMKLGLETVLLNPKTMEIFTPNTGQLTKLSEVRGDYIQGDDGKLNGSRPSSTHSGIAVSGGNSEKGVDKSGESDIIEIKEKRYQMPDEKFLDYSLDPVKQPDKAEAFKKALGFTKDNYKELKQKVLESLDEKKFVEKGDKGHGMLYEHIADITGANGKTAKVLTAWIKESDHKRLVSVYVKKNKKG